MPEVWLRNTLNVSETFLFLCMKFTWDTMRIYPRYFDIFLRFTRAWHFLDIDCRYWDSWDIPRIWLSHVRDIPEIYLRYTTHMPRDIIEICLRYAWDMPVKYLRYALYLKRLVMSLVKMWFNWLVIDGLSEKVTSWEAIASKNEDNLKNKDELKKVMTSKMRMT